MIQLLKSFIAGNIPENTGFFMWTDECGLMNILMNILGTICRKDQHSSAKLILIDSHSRNELSQISDCGASNLLSFDNITNFVSYLVATYVNENVYRGYKLQFIKCDCCLSDTCKHSIIRNDISYKNVKLLIKNKDTNTAVKLLNLLWDHLIKVIQTWGEQGSPECRYSIIQ